MEGDHVPRQEAILDKLYQVKCTDCCLNVEFVGFFGGFSDPEDGYSEMADVVFWLGRTRPFGTPVKVGGQALQIYEVD